MEKKNKYIAQGYPLLQRLKMNMTEDVNTQYWYMALRKLETEGKNTDKNTKKERDKGNDKGTSVQ